MSISGFGCSKSLSYTTVATVTVQTDGAATGTLLLSWYHGNSRTPQTSTTVATESVPLTKGQTSFSGQYSHYYGGDDTTADWGLTVSTKPPADSGNGSFQVTPRCGAIIT
ncbi:hypothetical protein GA0115240_116411 [Streptomyces sp. DvalAA-14]|uniref:hypothetical protein n=1 Tax=unclassified Streptomyces TaxID=2593676 RepID=UPI00081B599B|nr:MULTISPECIES: hypothetical protein [unclassified Streptomyces]MYS20090.1 hypothetical protein [Streptomyces sp. SID4948]SCD60672.1 hypothetical protein GA0115240_116411 [Streptomyces sp. DvalAA-14]